MSEIHVKGDQDSSLLIMIIGIIVMAISIIISGNLKMVLKFAGLFMFGAGIIIWISNSLMRWTGIENKQEIDI